MSPRIHEGRFVFPLLGTIAHYAVAATYGTFMLSALTEVVMGRSIAIAIFALGIGVFASAALLQWKVYSLRMDRSIPSLVASCACMLSMQAINLWMPQGMPEKALCFAALLVLAFATWWLALTSATIAAHQLSQMPRTLVADRH